VLPSVQPSEIHPGANSSGRAQHERLRCAYLLGSSRDRASQAMCPAANLELSARSRERLINCRCGLRSLFPLNFRRQMRSPHSAWPDVTSLTRSNSVIPRATKNGSHTSSRAWRRTPATFPYTLRESSPRPHTSAPSAQLRRDRRDVLRADPDLTMSTSPGSTTMGYLAKSGRPAHCSDSNSKVPSHLRT
jgi:hypothetical protein